MHDSEETNEDRQCQIAASISEGLPLWLRRRRQTFPLSIRLLIRSRRGLAPSCNDSSFMVLGLDRSYEGMVVVEEEVKEEQTMPRARCPRVLTSTLDDDEPTNSTTNEQQSKGLQMSGDDNMRIEDVVFGCGCGRGEESCQWTRKTMLPRHPSQTCCRSSLLPFIHPPSRC